MKPQTIIWTVLFIVGGAMLIYGAAFSTHGMGKAYVESVPVNPDDPADKRVKYETSTLKQFAGAMATDPSQTRFQFSLPRTIGIWVAAFFTLAIFSFLYKDNPFYKFAEAVLIGISAAYWMVVGFWTTIVPNLFGKLSPQWISSWAMPDLTPKHADYWWTYVTPLVLGVMMLWRLAPKGQWISRWALAFIIGTTAGLRLVAHVQADFVSQIRNGIMPLIVLENGFWATFWATLPNITLTVGVLACLVYFFFSFEHKGFVGKVAKLGIWFLMITFGAGFGYTVMGRIALLAARLEFLFDDWLWLIDPTKKRLVADLAAAAISALGLG